MKIKVFFYSDKDKIKKKTDNMAHNIMLNLDLFATLKICFFHNV